MGFPTQTLTGRTIYIGEHIREPLHISHLVSLVVEMPVLLSKPNVEGRSGRSMGLWTQKDGDTTTGLLEWTTPVPKDFSVYISQVAERIPTDDDVNRPEEARTLKIDSIFSGSPAALVYQCPQQPMDLHEILRSIEKPSGKDRRALGGIIATQVRSIHVHFQLQHTALRTESFVFFGNGNKPDLMKPYVLDWTRPSSPVHQHPEYRADRLLWYYDVWSLMIVLSEIAEWKPLSRAFRNEDELLKMKLQRKQMVTNPDWKGPETAALFQKGFGFLDKDRHTLEQLGRWEIKRFFDELCSLLAAAPRN
ncbi:hypothetical protein TOPH_08826 [Tolypocladium ophioglossoides CBS 100239]|uniref:Protein kinase domain-containing protein n=1 Tax=Tolypocladium ophioglossoides (strain CBS 100239) TaxID=1163406 RepID=A0A0L0MXK9_TOLOC|nr:hypothetical protein TOPH_08826 [Tolypocladium ophioglossoides CBS 100239]